MQPTRRLNLQFKDIIIIIIIIIIPFQFWGDGLGSWGKGGVCSNQIPKGFFKWSPRHSQ